MINKVADSSVFVDECWVVKYGCVPFDWRDVAFLHLSLEKTSFKSG